MSIAIAMPTVMGGTYIPEWAKTNDANHAYLKKLMAKPYTKKFATYLLYGVDSLQIYHSQLSKTKELFFVPINDLIQYAVEVDTIRTTGLVEITTVSQASVWRNREQFLTAGLPKWVFDTILYPRYNNILSDSLQSKHGRNFWSTQLADIFRARILNVYALGIKKYKGQFNVQSIHRVNLGNVGQFYTDDPDSSGGFYRLLMTRESLITST